ncbi:MAG TPA: hypothetical protein VJS30_31470 [Paraburkholderia sp.]|nr:hypothetical protein [Paraburkholderia sp.]
MRLSRAAIGVESIGHFALFHNRFETSLWPTTLGWPRTSQLAATTPGVIVSRHNTRD